MSIHINPVNAMQSSEGIAIAPEAMVIYPEDSEVFEFIRKYIDDWNYYLSGTVALDATAFISVSAGESKAEIESQCRAYIYGWLPGSVEWIEGSCVAIVFFDMPVLLVQEPVSVVTVIVQVKTGEAIIFNSKRTVSVLYETPSGTVAVPDEELIDDTL